MNACRTRVERDNPLRHLKIAEAPVIPGRNGFECDGIGDLVIRCAQREGMDLAHVAAIQIIAQRIRLLHHIFDNRKRGVGKNDVGPLRGIQEARPKFSQGRLPVPGVHHFVQRPILAPQRGAGNGQHDGDRRNHQQRQLRTPPRRNDCGRQCRSRGFGSFGRFGGRSFRAPTEDGRVAAARNVKDEGFVLAFSREVRFHATPQFRRAYSHNVVLAGIVRVPAPENGLANFLLVNVAEALFDGLLPNVVEELLEASGPLQMIACSGSFEHPPGRLGSDGMCRAFGI